MSDAGRDDEHDDVEREVAERLTQQRPVPAAGFRGALGRRLADRDPGFGPRPEHLVPLVSAGLGGGLALIALAALLATGSL
jgi:hypothetical protein